MFDGRVRSDMFFAGTNKFVGYPGVTIEGIGWDELMQKRTNTATTHVQSGYDGSQEPT